MQPSSQHVPTSHATFPDSTSQISSTSHPTQLALDGSSVSYSQGYSFRHQDPSTTVVSSTEPENSSVASSQSNLNQTQHGINLHQRRGSLQLWQFLVALLDEPSQR